MKDISGITNEKDGDIIFVTVAKYKLFMSYGKIGMDAYCLYSHMMFTARLQETNQIYAKDTYLRNGLSWSKERIQKAKQLLIELELITEIIKRDKDGKFSGKYIKVVTKTTPFEIKEIIHPEDGKPADGETASRSLETNALTNNINALTNNIKQSKSLRTKELSSSANESFNIFWTNYDYKKDKVKCMDMWGKIDEVIHKVINKHVIEYVKSTPDKAWRKQPYNYLKNECWNDEIVYRKSGVTQTQYSEDF